MEVELVAIEELVVLPLILHVLADRVFVQTDRGDEVSSAPEALLGEGALSGEGIVDSDGALPLEEAHGIGDGILGWDAEYHVHVIGAGIALKDFDVFLLCQFSYDFADLDSDRTEQDSLPILWYDDHVVLAIPDHVIL